MNSIGDRMIRGSVLKGYEKYIKKRWGQQGICQCEKFIGIEFGDISDGKWYNQIFSEKILKWISSEKGSMYVKECGKHTTKDLGILSYIVRFTTIKMMLKRAPEQFHDAFSYGDVKIDIGDKRALVHMRDTAIDENTCLAFEGVYEALLELTHTKGKVTKKQCQLKGADRCIFEIDWS
ncbi:MAG TPA: hypothetical protein ENN76_02685 [Euryarchaeota archaeon]|nr:hypothetical protein [Euryarchaeota archaeon]